MNVTDYIGLAVIVLLTIGVIAQMIIIIIQNKWENHSPPRYVCMKSLGKTDKSDKKETNWGGAYGWLVSRV